MTHLVRVELAERHVVRQLALSRTWDVLEEEPRERLYCPFVLL